MADRVRPSLIVGLFATLLLGGLSGFQRLQDAHPAMASDSGSAVEADVEHGLKVTWIFDSSEFLSCSPPTPVLRHLKQVLGDRVQVHATVVGDDPERAERFLHSERLAAEINRMSAAEYEREYGKRELPIVVANNGSSRTVLSHTAWTGASNQPVSQLATVVEKMAGSARH